MVEFKKINETYLRFKRQDKTSRIIRNWSMAYLEFTGKDINLDKKIFDMPTKFYLHELIEKLIKLHNFVDWSKQDNDFLKTILKNVESKQIQIEDCNLDFQYFGLLITYAEEGIFQLRNLVIGLINEGAIIDDTSKLIAKLWADYLIVIDDYKKDKKMNYKKLEEIIDCIDDKRKELHKNENHLIKTGNIISLGLYTVPFLTAVFFIFGTVYALEIKILILVLGYFAGLYVWDKLYKKFKLFLVPNLD